MFYIDRNKLILIFRSYKNKYDIFIKLYYEVINNQQYATDIYSKNLNKNKVVTTKLRKIIFTDEKIELTEEDCKSIINYINSTSTNEEVLMYCLDLLIAIDQSYVPKKKFVARSSKVHKKNINPLNTYKTYDIGKVYYKINASYIHNKYESKQLTRLQNQIGDNIDRFIENIYVFNDSHISYKVNVLKINTNSISDILEKNKSKLKISLIPFVCQTDYLKVKNVKLDEDSDIENGFIIEGTQDEEDYINNINLILEDLNKDKVNIVVFPEMTMTTKLFNEVKNYLKNNENNFLLVVCGTIWKDNTNICYVLDGNGLEISTQYKLNRFQKSPEDNVVGNIENLDVRKSDNTIHIYDIDKLGRICTPICVDFITDNYFRILHEMKVNFILAPVYTSKLDSFEINSFNIVKSNHAVVFISNCCIPLLKKSTEDSFKDINVSFYRLPLRKNDDVVFIKSCENVKNCKKTYCKYQIIEI